MIDLSSLVPPLAVELGVRPGSHWTRVDGSMLSADISGFTALTEQMSRRGKAGAEQITELINTCFATLINAAGAYGGEVLKFGGDALLVVFRGPEHRVDAGLAAIAMQQALVNLATARNAHLTMTVGVAEGPFDVFLVGAPRRELLITGAAASEVIRLEAVCEKGGTLMSPAIAEALASRLRSEDGGGLLTRPAAPPPSPSPDAALEVHVPGSLLDQFEAFTSLGGEHRPVAIGFVSVGGIDELIARRGGDAVCELLATLVNTVRDACVASQVSFLHSDIAPGGVKLLLAAGAPLTSGHDEDGILHAALAIAALDTPFTVKVGVNVGRAFAGFLGSEHRRAYTLMGDPVNTTARLLGAAGRGDVIATDALLRVARSTYRSEPLDPFHVKGKSEPIHAQRVIAASAELGAAVGDADILGRDEELARIDTVLARGHGVIHLVGATGVGKSRLLAAAVSRAGARTVARAACTAYGAKPPYAAVRPLVRRLLGIDVAAAPEAAGAALVRLVRQHRGDLEPMVPLVAVPVGAEVDDTPEASAIDDDFRRQRAHEHLVELLSAVVDGDLLVAVEDVHRADEASAELLAELARAAARRRWCLVTTGSTGVDTPISEIEGASVIELTPLDDAAIRRLVIEASDRPLADSVIDAVVRRAAGNPLFARELTLAASADPTSSRATDLPTTVEQVIATRLDRLDPSARRLLRIAAVIGETVARSDLDDVLRVEAPGLSIDHSTVGDILVPAGVGQWRFTHGIYRDAAYEGLPFRQRRRLHRVVGESIEARADDPLMFATTLSLHFSSARIHDKAWRYSVAAGRAAVAQHANAEAAAAFERALTSAALARSPRADRRAVAEALGDACFELARFARARSAYDVARKGLGGSVDDVAMAMRVSRKIGAVHERSGNPTQALRWYRRTVQAGAAHPEEPAIVSEAAQARLAEAGIRHRQGDQDACYALAAAARDDAERAHDAPTEALALERMHLALTYGRDPRAAEIGARALALHRDLDSRSGMVRTLINRGIEAYFGGDWAAAAGSYLEATEIGRAAGSVVLAETAAINSAEILADQGHWLRAIELLTDARRNWEAVGYPVGVAAATLFLAVAQTRALRLDDARRMLDDARNRLDALGVAELLDDLRTRELEWRSLAGHATPHDATELLRELGDGHPLATRVQRSLGVALAHAGELDAAADALTRSAEAAGASTYDHALSLDALARVLPQHPGAAAARSTADETFLRLAVVEPPPVVVAASNACGRGLHSVPDPDTASTDDGITVG